MTGLLSTSALPAPSVKKAYILYETYLDSSPECNLCISKKAHTLASLLRQSCVLSLTAFQLNLSLRGEHQRFTVTDAVTEMWFA